MGKRDQKPLKPVFKVFPNGDISYNGQPGLLVFMAEDWVDDFVEEDPENRILLEWDSVVGGYDPSPTVSEILTEGLLSSHELYQQSMKGGYNDRFDGRTG